MKGKVNKRKRFVNKYNDHQKGRYFDVNYYNLLTTQNISPFLIG